MAKKTIDDSWERYPEAKIRMREDGLNTILEGLGEDGFCHGAEPRFHLLDDGVYVDILLNVGKYGSIVALPLEIFIPAKMLVPKKKAKAKVEETTVTIPEVVVPVEFATPVESEE